MIGFFVWGHHMFVAGQSAFASLVFSFLSFLVAVPSAIKVFNWTATLYRGQITFEAPMLYALGFVGLFTMGGLTGLFLASVPIDIHVTDTYFVVAHFHYIMVGGMVSAFFGGLHFWWPKITGRLYHELWAQIAAVLMFAGFNATFFPQYILGYLGMPRRYHAYAPEFQPLHVASSLGAVVLGAAYLLPLAYLGWSLFRGERAPTNPWNAKGLEWTTPSPPPKHNFAAAAGGRRKTPTTTTGRGRPRMASAGIVAEQFDDRAQQRTAAELGMWIFLGTELLFFGGLFLGYALYRHIYTDAFTHAGRETKVLIGTMNTGILLTSSFTVALAVKAAKLKAHRLLQTLLAITVALGIAFVALKLYEYHEDIKEHLDPRQPVLSDRPRRGRRSSSPSTGS